MTLEQTAQAIGRSIGAACRYAPAFVQLYVYAYAAVSPQDDKLESLVLPEVNGQWMQAFLTEMASRYPQEHIWDELREKHFLNETFDSLDLLDEHLVESLRVLQGQNDTVKGIAGWEWIIDVLLGVVVTRCCCMRSA